MAEATLNERNHNALITLHVRSRIGKYLEKDITFKKQFASIPFYEVNGKILMDVGLIDIKKLQLLARTMNGRI